MDSSLTVLWQQFAELRQKMLDSAAVDEWEQVALTGIERQEVEKQISSVTPSATVDESLVELMQSSLEKNKRLVSLARRSQVGCQTQMSTLATGKKAAAAYAP